MNEFAGVVCVDYQSYDRVCNHSPAHRYKAKGKSDAKHCDSKDFFDNLNAKEEVATTFDLQEIKIN